MPTASKSPVSDKNLSAEAEKLAAFLRSRAPAEDLGEYEPVVLERSAALAYRALKKHKRGDSVIAIDSDPALVRRGRPLTVITVINDNMPFLFDSITGEIADHAGEASLVLHPVVLVRHDKSGVAELIGESIPGKADADADRVSLIQVHVGRLGEEAAAALTERLAHVLSQVRAAVGDW